MKQPFRTCLLATLVLCYAESLHAQWVQTNFPSRGIVQTIGIAGESILASVWADSNNNNGVYLSTNDGSDWIAADSGLTSSIVTSFAVNSAGILAGTNGSGVFQSTKSGRRWVPLNSGLANLAISSLLVQGDTVFAGSSNSVFISTNSGTNWNSVDVGASGSIILCFALLDAKVFASTGNGIFRSTDNGLSWEALGQLHGENVSSFTVMGKALFANTENRLYRSTDEGATWSPSDSGLVNPITCLAVGGNGFFAGTGKSGVYLSTNEGYSWTPVNSGLADLHITSLATDGSFIFAGPFFGSIWRRSISEMVTAVKTDEVKLPCTSLLHQNYPNPFNPTTVIRYSLPRRSQVTLDVFNNLGQKIATLVDGEVSAGTHEARFEARGLASGVYFYRIQAGEFIQTKSLLLLK